MTRDQAAPTGNADGPEPAHVAAPADLAGLLADPVVWAEPSDDLEDRVVAAIAAEASQRSD